jgi:hypothetical protein
MACAVEMFVSVHTLIFARLSRHLPTGEFIIPAIFPRPAVSGRWKAADRMVYEILAHAERGQGRLDDGLVGTAVSQLR